MWMAASAAPNNNYKTTIMRMLLFYIPIIVSSALARSQLSQRVTDPVWTYTYPCYVRYVCATQHKDVLVVHRNHADVSSYVACIQSLFTVINLGNHPQVGREILLQPYDLVVLLVTTADDMTAHNSLLYKMPHRGRAARYLVVGVGAVHVDAYSIFYLLVGQHLLNVALLWPHDPRVFAFLPMHGDNCGISFELKVLGQCRQLSFNGLYPVKIPKRFSGCQLIIVMLGQMPAVIDRQSSSEQPLVAGYELALYNIIVRRLNLTSNIKIGNFAYALDCVDAFAYYMDTLRWYVPAAAPGAQWKSLLLVFQPPLWYAVLAFLLFNTLVWWTMDRTHSYVECVLGTLLVLLGGSVPWPRRTGMRFLVISWTLCALVLVAAYQCQFLSILLAPVYDKQIADEQELFASGVPIDLNKNTLLALSKSATFSRLLHHKGGKLPADNSYVIPKDHARLQYELTAKYLARNNVDARGKSTVYVLKKPVAFVPMCLAIDPGHPAMDRVNMLMQGLVENGIVSKFMRDVDFSTRISLDEPEDTPITLHHLKFAFTALMLGHSLATVTFLLEKIAWRIGRR